MRKICLETIYNLSKLDKKILFIGSDLGPGVLSNMQKESPERFFMEGISEQHIIGMAAGLAMDGFMPYVNTIGTFLTRRCYEQILVDVCLHNLPIRLIANGGGLVYAPLGPTHQSIEDIALLKSLPNLSIIAPCDEIEMEKIMHATLNCNSPLFIRIGKGDEKIITDKSTEIIIGKSVVKKDIKKIVIISTGVMTQTAIEVSDKLKKEDNIEVGVVHMHTIKPLDVHLLDDLLNNSKLIFTLEEHIRDSGFGTSILEYSNDNFPIHTSKIIRIGLENKFQENYGSQAELLKLNKLDAESIYKKIKSNTSNQNVN